MLNQAKSLLQDVFGYDSFRPLQQEIISNVLHKYDTLVIMPTGGGKSLCYQIPALIFPGLTVVVSPLIALMKDQVGQLTELGVSAAVLNSSLSPSEYQANVARIVQEQVKLLYMAPETLLLQRTQALLNSVQVDCLAIDEAHCISEWGHDFRPEYRQLAEVRSRFPSAVCIALTATATPRVQEDIKQSLHFDQSNEFIASFNRTNLLLEVAEKRNPVLQTVECIEKFSGQSGLIYCLSRKQVDELASLLADEGFSVKPYHAGLSDAERKRNQELFIRDDVQIVVATVAFGMGIDKPDIRYVIHYDLPKNIESYYQQIGRAGRDGLDAHCLLLFGYGDLRKIRRFIEQKNDQEQRVALMHLNQLVGLLETDVCRRIPLLRYFGEQCTESNCGMCDNCLSDNKDLVDITIPAQKFLSCVKRTGEMFGAGHIIDVLRGSQNQKVFKFQHDRLSTYNIGTEFSKQQWFHLSRQFLQKGLMTQDIQHGSLKLTDKAWDVFRGKEQVLGQVEEQRVERGKATHDRQEHDSELFEILRQKRKELADAANLPPYAIFPDTALLDMAAYFPQTEANFLAMQGVGKVKLKRYGDIFLELITDYCQKKNIAEKSKRQWKTAAAQAKASMAPRHVVVGEAFNDGKTVGELRAEFGHVKQQTILNHLYKYIQDGHELRASDEFLELSSLSAREHKAVFSTFDHFGTNFLRPIYDTLNGRIPYDELHLLRLAYLAREARE
ncbi:DNA helicase RecQ [candidate division KSB3 bacterium]|uniref:DNA helicase RecQ n=1 Tax=candidate division KSB3 bacterium TaxID=2044937 RepID=A0A2G6KAG0_9BACT|nr:MAG: DNA helicase RecQ [candidate division KSB3 bacterium]